MQLRYTKYKNITLISALFYLLLNRLCMSLHKYINYVSLVCELVAVCLSTIIIIHVNSTGPRSVQVIRVTEITSTSATIWWSVGTSLDYDCTYNVTITEDPCTEGLWCDQITSSDVSGNGTRRYIFGLFPGRSYPVSVLTIKHGVTGQPITSGFRTREYRSQRFLYVLL